MPRPKKETAEKRAILAAPPKAERDWTAIINARTEDPQKREALLLQMAQLDELVRTFRKRALDGVANAGRLIRDLERDRARLLGLTTAVEDDDSDPNEIDVPDWTPSTPSTRRASAEGDDDE